MSVIRKTHMPSEQVSVEQRAADHTPASMGACTIGFTITVELEAMRKKEYGPYFVSEDALPAITRQIGDEIGISAEHHAHRFKVTAGKIARQAAKDTIPTQHPDVRQMPQEVR
jgi:hypothetical protein